jgi:hypothetical protein
MQIPTQKNPTIAATSQTWNKIDKPVQKSTSTTNRIENSLELLLMQSFPRWCHEDPGIKAGACNPKNRRRESIQRRKCARKRRERTLSFSGDQEVEETERKREKRIFTYFGDECKGVNIICSRPSGIRHSSPSVLAKCLATNNKWSTHNTLLLLFLSLSLSLLPLSVLLRVSFIRIGCLSSENATSCVRVATSFIQFDT